MEITTIDDSKPSWNDYSPTSLKVDQVKYPSPDLSLRTAIWVPSEKCFMYFKKDATEEFIMKRLELYKHRVITR